MTNKIHKNNRIKYLEKKYSQTNLAKGECVSDEYRKQINQNYHRTQKKHTIQSVLNDIRNPLTVKDEVYSICNEIDNLKTLNRTAKVEQIIAIIVLYVQRLHNPKLKEEESKLWKKYGLSWRLYGRVVARLLYETRRNRPL